MVGPCLTKPLECLTSNWSVGWAASTFLILRWLTNEVQEEVAQIFEPITKVSQSSSMQFPLPPNIVEYSPPIIVLLKPPPTELPGTLPFTPSVILFWKPPAIFEPHCWDKELLYPDWIPPNNVLASILWRLPPLITLHCPWLSWVVWKGSIEEVAITALEFEPVT